ncbi:amino acid ABC transporter permease [Pseudomonas berkeleyensis]|uniref:Amino acid ABC transporter permease n=1 Tax=Pseudomonas berkeleyensis TaxID=2726956 RepID=A0A7G5DRE0_9PSED|nr:amino acid ABC transporter permease [Pseudomonas berkeleyensis]QMV64315.1 amino acid ABC transporter permease [Pseudomonas berkeleyensis]WSO39779.1 amino acid ABC transporter permease [Pseudomonas berkeleyensis]
MELLQAWFTSWGVNLTILWDPIDRQRFLLGLALTIALSVLSVAISLVIGVLGAWMKGSRWELPRQLVTLYVEVFRNTPLLIQLFFFYFGLGALLSFELNDGNAQSQLIVNFFWALLVLGIHAGAYQVEAIRGSLDAVPRSTIEAAQSLGLNPVQTFRKVVLPLALRNALPSVGNSLVQAVKATSVAYAIAVPELTYAANRIWSDNFNVPEMMVVLFITYFTLLGLVSMGMRAIERRLTLPGYHGL